MTERHPPLRDPHLEDVAHWHPIEGTPEKKKVAIGCSIGATIETYDFIGFGTAAALYFNHVFFRPPTRFRAPCCPSPRWVSASRYVRWAGSSAATWATGSAASPFWSGRCC
jgi:hypothetical protein